MWRKKQPLKVAARPTKNLEETRNLMNWGSARRRLREPRNMRSEIGDAVVIPARQRDTNPTRTRENEHAV